MFDNVLFIDDDKVTLGYLKDLFAPYPINGLFAFDPLNAMRILSDNEVAVVVTDNLMPGMCGLELLSMIRENSPDTTKILMSASPNMTTTFYSVVASEVYRFLLKPWSNTEMIQAVNDGIQRYRMFKSIKKETEKLFSALLYAVELNDPCKKGHCDRVANYAMMLAGAFGLPDNLIEEIKYGGWLHDCGKIGVPETILNSSYFLSASEREVVKMHTSWGAEVLRKANLSSSVVNVALYHHERYDGKGYPEGLTWRNIPIEAQIVAIADVYDALMSDRSYRVGYSQEQVLTSMVKMAGREFDPDLVRLFIQKIEEDHIR